MNIIISLLVGICAAVFMHHWSRNANYNGLTARPTWKLVWVFFIGFTAITYGLIAL